MPDARPTHRPPQRRRRRSRLAVGSSWTRPCTCIADEGLRGLTHRAVDRRAGLPEGSCSAYWRTRNALQAALTEYVAASLLADVDGLTEQISVCGPDDEQAAVAATLELFLQWLDQRELLVARLELTMAATRDARPRPAARRPPRPARSRSSTRSSPRPARTTARRAPRRWWRRTTASCWPRCCSRHRRGGLPGPLASSCSARALAGDPA